MTDHSNARLRFLADAGEQQQTVFSVQASDFVADLIQRFAAERTALLEKRIETQNEYDSGKLPDFIPETANIRTSDWRCYPLPTDLLDRRVEITGPTSRKMVINALNANVKCFMADFEDSLSPTWSAIVEGQSNLRDAVQGTISFVSPDGKEYALRPNPAILICRVRGLHLNEKHLELAEGQRHPTPGALVDFGLYFYHNYQQLLEKNSGPYFYLPKLESWKEAAWWSKVFCYTEDKFGLERGTIKATVLIETLPAAFQMHEILFALKEHAAGLNCGRWDYIFSYIKTLRSHADRILPDRHTVTMDKPFLNAYSRLLIRTCHTRGVMAMGGMSAFIPAKDQQQNQIIFDKVRADKELEANNGHDGTWVAHPGLADLVMDIFNAKLGQQSNQITQLRETDAPITATELLDPSSGACTEVGMRANLRVSLQYIEAWLRGNGCVPIYGLMEDAATAEISRTSIWQWLHHQVSLDNGKPLTEQLCIEFLEEEAQVVATEIGSDAFHAGKFAEAKALLQKLITNETLDTFLTLDAYEQL